MTSIPSDRHEANGDTDVLASPDPTVRVVRRVVRAWPIFTVIFIAGGGWATLNSQSTRIDAVEKHQERSDVRIDDRLRNVEQGVATLLERTKPHR